MLAVSRCRRRLDTGDVQDGGQIGRRIASDAQALAYLAPGFVGLRREALRVVHLDGECGVVGVRLIYSNRCDAADFPLRTIVGDALSLGSRGIVLAHNHPSGDPAPSRDDLAATRALAMLARPLGIRLFDHLIFAGRAHSSLRAMGLV